MENLDYNCLYPQDKTAFFGFFECQKDEAAAACLLETAVQWARENSYQRLLGPVSYSVNETAGLLIQGFDIPPSILMPYNPPWYAGFLEKNGFTPVIRFLAYEIDEQRIHFPPLTDRLSARLESCGYRFRTIDMTHLEQEAHRLTEIFNQSWRENWGFVPFEADQFLDAILQIRSIIAPELVLIAEQNHVPVAFAAALPDINQALMTLNGRLFPLNFITFKRNLKKIDQIRVLLMGVLPEHRSRGIDLILYKKLLETAPALGYHKAELSWILENNAMMNNIVLHIGASVSKIYALYDKKWKASPGET